ncbi:phenylalanine--tRNA ligase subunit beta [Actinomyces sp. HMSC062G12]|nr:phenylalanine--tRNA ligase subunit beta [Actinomyces sp. HMSC062G12]
MPMVPLSWLADHVDIAEGTDARALAAALVKVGLEEEKIHPARVTGPLVVGRVLTRTEETASNGKVVNYCRVDVGDHNDAPGTGKEPSALPSRGIICGAHNFDVDDLVVVSLPGAVLPGDFQIAARKTYGHVSDGMICSARELGLGEDHSGIIVLPRFFPDREIPPVGTDIVSWLGLGEEILEINVTPDRGYCFSMRGIAREYSHSTGASFRDPGDAGVIAQCPPSANGDGFPVVFADDAPIRGHLGVDRFVTRVVSGTNPGASTPRWMVERLEAAGMRSVSLPVDITNYVMLDLGQPMHAYDLGALSAPIVVRRARVGETLVTLDEEPRELDVQDLLITDSPSGDASRVIGIAGVMGGAYSEVGESTTDVLFEAAHFDAVSVARSARRHKLHSEASKRFERGTDPALPAIAAQRAVELLVQYGGGTVHPGVTDEDQRGCVAQITLPVTEAERLTGAEYTPERVAELLRAVGCTVEEPVDGVFAVTPPSWRPDLTLAADLVEEVARLDGYDNIPVVLPTAPAGRGLTLAQKARRLAATALADGGLVEVKSYPFVSDTWDRQGIPADDSRRQALRLRNPMADDTPWLRTSVLDTLLDVAGRNVSRSNADVAIFEIAKVAKPCGTVPADLPGAEHRPGDAVLAALEAGIPAQPWHVGGVLTGRAVAAGVLSQARAFDWADALDYVREVASGLGVRVEVTRAWVDTVASHKGAPMPTPATDPARVAPFHPGRVARVFVRAGRELIDVALAGELSPVACREFGLPARSCAFEIDMDALISQMSAQPIQVKRVSTFPLAKEDIALVVPCDIPASRVEQIVRQGAGALTESVTLFDIYEGDQVPEGYRSLAFALRLRAADHTLTAKEAAKVRTQVVDKAAKVLGASLRA